jgi:ABC-2 type transport system permease protein
MNLTYLRIDLVRQLRHPEILVFVIALPVVMYLIFGSTFAQGNDPAGAGNVHFYVMVSMAVYGATLAVTTISGGAALEVMQGWGRQIALTPLRPAGYVAMKTVVALILSAVAVAAVFIAGLLTGAQAGSWRTWLVSLLITWLGSALFALFGLAVAQTFRSESAVGIANGALVVLSFFGNLFVPLSGTMLQVARFTPLYGYTGLARWPQLEGANVNPTAPGFTGTDSLGMLIANYAVWAAIFALWATLAMRRGRSRQ